MDDRMKSQNKRIEEYLKNGKSLTPISALSLFNCFRLAARVSDLRKQGLTISDKWYYIPRSKKRVKLYYINLKK